MTRRRLLTVAYSLGCVLLVVGGLTAAKAVGDKGEPAPEAAKSSGAKKLVCLGFADTDDPIIRIYPDNFPQPVKVTKVLVPEGAVVKAGQPLLAFDDRIAKLRIEEAEAGVAAAKQEKVKAQAAVDSHVPQVNALNNELSAEAEKLKAKQSELAETQRLFKIMGQKTQNELEAAEAAVKAAEFMLDSVRWKLKGLKDHNPQYLVDLADAGVKRAESVLEQAKYGAEQYACNAPANGKIIRSFASDGMTFGPHSREPAFWFIKDTPLIFRCEVNQEFARRVTKGMTGRIEDDADPSLTWKGKVVRIADQYLLKRSGGGAGPDMIQMSSEERVLECILSIELAPNEAPPRYGQKLKVTLGE
ncbi:HlyD family secretion protein [Zavarzinella formosa]|uniref:biotin/lipoyl-binding protein n=1 Tax=Zavarzinella formosa TaxID=360055 RepID=UPI000315E3F1|nr:biotin/lipoyl-binding protein [Zavarzinella formosa]